jgi:hypothetical protein
VSDYLKSGIIILCLLGAFGCKGENSIKRSIENGVEVVENPLYVQSDVLHVISPYREISQQKKDLIQCGLRSMGEFDVDEAGNIFIIGYKNEKNFVYKLNPTGEYLLSFGARGQGPGELERPMRPTVSGNRVYISDPKKKVVIFGTDGKFIEERRFPVGIDTADPLPDSNFVIFGINTSVPPGPDYANYFLGISDYEFSEIKVIDTYKWFFRGDRLMPFFMWRISRDHIIVINEERNYEVLEFDFSGNMVRKIKKPFLPQYADSIIKEKILGKQKPISSSKNNYIPSPLPCIRFFIADKEGRLLIMTYERGKGPESFKYDVFDSSGGLIGQIDLNLDWAGEYFGLKKYLIKNGLFYYYEDDKDGYSIMKIDKIQWPKHD